MILDTDIGTDADDAIALAFAIRHPQIDLTAVTTVSGDAGLRARLARRLLLLAERDDVEVAAGIGRDGPAAVASAWVGHEGDGVLEPDDDVDISPRHAVDVLLAEQDAELVTIGPQSNLAAAVERDAAFAARVRSLTVMGGAFRPIVDLGEVQPPVRDHNIGCDPAASAVSLNAGMPILYVPLDVTAATWFTHDDVARLHGGDALCRAVARLIDVWTGVLRRLTTGAYPADRAVALHDPLAVACTVERSFVTTEAVPVTVAAHAGHARTFVDPLEGTPAEVVTSVDLAALRAFLLDTLLAAA